MVRGEQDVPVRTVAPSVAHSVEGGLRYRHWPTEQEPKAVVQILHGLGEHSGRYEHVARHLNRAGYAVFCHDHLGHGESPGKRAFVRHFDDYSPGIDDIRQLITAEYPSLPCVLLGHSMGGLLAAATVLRQPTHYLSMVLSGPAFATPVPPPALLQWLVRILARIAPGLGVLALDPNAVSRDPRVVDHYRADPLVHHGKVTAGLALALFSTMAEVLERAHEVQLPLLVMHGSADALTDPEGSRMFVERVGSGDKTLTLWPGLYHEIFNEPESEAVLAAMTNWLNERIGDRR